MNSCIGEGGKWLGPVYHIDFEMDTLNSTNFYLYYFSITKQVTLGKKRFYFVNNHFVTSREYFGELKADTFK